MVFSSRALEFELSSACGELIKTMEDLMENFLWDGQLDRSVMQTTLPTYVCKSLLL